MAYLKTVLTSIHRYVNSIGELQEILMALAAQRHNLVAQAARMYAAEMKMLKLLCYEFLEIFVKGNPPKRIPLEFLENVFLSAKKVALEAVATAEMLESKRSKAAKDARRTADQAISLAREVAKALAREMRTQDTWSKKIVKEIELEDWL